MTTTDPASTLSRGKVAVITRTKNRPNFLRRAMLSILEQTHEDWIHVIVNDGGRRGEIDLLATEFAGHYRGRLKVLHLPDSLGMQNASNAGIEASSSDYIIIHDDDDSLHPDYLLKATSKLCETDDDGETIKGVVSQTWRINETIDMFGDFKEVGRWHYMPLDYVAIARFGGENPFPPISFIYRREAHDEIGLFNQRYNVLGDWDFHYRFAQRYEIAVLPDLLANYHWRVGTQPAGFSNTVTTGVDEHLMQQNKLRNDYVRRLVKDAPSQIAPMLNMGHELYQTKQQLFHANSQISSMKKDLDGLIHELEGVRDRAQWIIGKGKRSKRAQSKSQVYRPHTHQPTLPFEYEKFLKTAQRRKVISFDIFDTCLLRTTQKPTDVFLVVQSQMKIQRDGEDIPFAPARIYAERCARRKVEHGEITFDAIYEELKELLKLTPEETTHLRELELKLERQILYRNEIIHKFYTKLKAMGKRVIFISDMYFPKAILSDLLERNGFAADEIYVSCDHLASKHDGNLYDIALKAEGVNGADVLHIGDNYRSDIERAQQRGLKICQFIPANLPKTYYANSPRVCNYTPARDLTTCAIGLFQKHRVDHLGSGDNYWEQFGYEIAGPLYFFYTKWLVQQAQESGRQQLIFLARDGYYLNKTFEILEDSWSTGLRGKYVYASRRLFNLAAIEGLDESALDFLSTPNPNLRVRDLLDRLDFEPGQFRKQAKQAGFKSLDELIASAEGSFKDASTQHKVHALMHLLSIEITEKASEERLKLFEYFDSLNLNAEDSVFVDIGWQASSVKSISNLLSMKNGTSTPLLGCYFGTWHFAQPVIDMGNELRSFFHHLNYPESRSNLIHQSVSIIESIFSAPHPSIVGIQKTDSDWQPIYTRSTDQSIISRRVESIWSGAEKFVKAMAPLSNPESKDDGIELLETLLTRILRHPTKAEAKMLGNIEHRESFGNTPASTVVSQPPRHSLIKPLIEGHRNSNWKQGYLAQLSSRQVKKLCKRIST